MRSLLDIEIKRAEREQKAAAKAVRFGTQIIVFSASTPAES